jgi:hypothetical protein
VLSGEGAGEVGTGVFEQLILGDYAPMDLSGMEVAPA